MRKLLVVLVILSALAVTPSLAGAASPQSQLVQGTVALSYDFGCFYDYYCSYYSDGFGDLEGIYHGNIFEGYFVDLNLDLAANSYNNGVVCGNVSYTEDAYMERYVSGSYSGLDFRVNGKECVNTNTHKVVNASLTLTAVYGYGQFAGYGGTLHASLASAQGPLSIYGTITPGLTNGNNNAPVRTAPHAGAHQ